MGDKMQPGRFTLRFNMNDPQQRAAVEILNRLGRQKAQFLAQALVHYTECGSTTAGAGLVDEQALEQAILSVLARHPNLTRQECSEETTGQPSLPHVEHTEDTSPVWDTIISGESLDAINKTLAAFRSQ